MDYMKNQDNSWDKEFNTRPLCKRVMLFNNLSLHEHLNNFRHLWCLCWSSLKNSFFQSSLNLFLLLLNNKSFAPSQVWSSCPVARSLRSRRPFPSLFQTGEKKIAQTTPVCSVIKPQFLILHKVWQLCCALQSLKFAVTPMIFGCRPTLDPSSSSLGMLWVLPYPPPSSCPALRTWSSLMLTMNRESDWSSSLHRKSSWESWSPKKTLKRSVSLGLAMVGYVWIEKWAVRISFCLIHQVVHCVRHLATGTIIAKKMIHLEVKPAIKKQIITELR